MNRFFASLGAELLIPQVHLVFTPQSIIRLREISLHPVFSHHVKSLLYEADRLNHYHGKSDWLHHVHEDFWGASGPPRRLQRYNEDGEEVLTAAYMRWREGPKHSYTKNELHDGWLRFQELYGDQECTEILEPEISSAVARFPNLTEIRLSIDGEIFPQSGYLATRLIGGLVGPTGPYRARDLQPPGFNAVHSVLRGLVMSETHKVTRTNATSTSTKNPSWFLNQCIKMTNLTVLHLGSVNPLLFKTLVSKYGKIASTIFRGLRDIKLVLNWRDFEGHVDHMRTIRSQDALDELARGSLMALLVEAHGLQKLSIRAAVDYAPWHAINLMTVMGDHMWKQLQELILSGFNTELEYFLNVVKRHQGTLDTIIIEEATLVTPTRHNAWAQLLLDLRGIKQWRDITLYGNLFGGVPRGANDEPFPRPVIHDYYFNGYCDGPLIDEDTIWLRDEIRRFALRQVTQNPFAHYWDDPDDDENAGETIYDAENNSQTSNGSKERP